jgi:transposase
VPIGAPKDLIDCRRFFLEATHPRHRQYEALRAYFVEGRSSQEVATTFGYSVGAFRVLWHHFRRTPRPEFFVAPRRGPQTQPKKSAARDAIIDLRKQNYSVYEISEALKKDGISRTPAAVSQVLRQEGFVKLPRRQDDERPQQTKPTAADPSDARALSLEPRVLRTKFGGLFLFLPAMVQSGFDRVIGKCALPGTKMVPAAHAVRSLLALKLFGSRRHTHVMSAVLDEGLALFAGLNVIPKRSFLTEYSCRINPASYPMLMQHWFDAMRRLGLEHW